MPWINVLRCNDLGFPRYEQCGLFASLRDCSKHRSKHLLFEASFRSTYLCLTREICKQRVDFCCFVPGADILERLRGFAPRKSRLIPVPQRARGLAKLPQHLRLQQPVFQTLCFEDRDSQRRDAGVVRSAFALDSGSAFQRAGDGEVIAPAARALE